MKYELKLHQQSTRRLTTLYMTALTTIAIFALIGQIVVQLSLNQQSSDALVINLAGRQRFLSLRITLAASCLVLPSDPLSRDSRISELRTALNSFENEHRGLIYGDSALGLPGHNSPTISQMFNTMQPDFDAITGSAKDVLNTIDTNNAASIKTPTTALTPDVNTILAHEENFVTTMNQTVAQYQHEAEERVTSLRIIEVVLCTLTLAVLFLEGFFVFRPAVDRIKKSTTELVGAEKQLVQRTQELERKNNDLELAFNEALAAHRKVMPHARVVSYGRYQVQGSQGSYFTVSSHEEGGNMRLECECLMYRRNLICSHSIAAATLHSALVRQRNPMPTNRSTTNFNYPRQITG